MDCQGIALMCERLVEGFSKLGPFGAACRSLLPVSGFVLLLHKHEAARLRGFRAT